MRRLLRRLWAKLRGCTCPGERCEYKRPRLRVRLRRPKLKRPKWLRLPLDKDDRQVAGVGAVLAVLFGLGLPYGALVVGFAIRAFMFGAGF